MTAIARVKNKPTTVVMDCDAGLAVDDLVYQDMSDDNRVLKNTDQNSPRPVIGFVASKPTATTAEIVLLGVVSYTIARGPLFVGADGKLSLSGATVGYLQKMGFSFGNGSIYLNPETQRIKRV